MTNPRLSEEIRCKAPGEHSLVVQVHEGERIHYGGGHWSPVYAHEGKLVNYRLTPIRELHVCGVYTFMGSDPTYRNRVFESNVRAALARSRKRKLKLLAC